MNQAPETDIGWTEARIGLLKKMWADKASVDQIAAELGGVTRNTVVGKAYRLGLPKRGRPAAAKPKIARTADAQNNDRKITQTIQRAIAAPVVMDGPEAVDLSPEIVPADRRKTLLELTEDTCRWPVGEFFCGEAAVRNRPYCDAHCRRAFAAPRAPLKISDADRQRRKLQQRRFLTGATA